MIGLGIVIAVVIALIVGFKAFELSGTSGKTFTKETVSEAVKGDADGTAGVEDIYNIGDFNIEAWRHSGKPLIINFSSNTCEPCKQMKKNLEEIKKEYGNAVVIKVVDVEKYADKISRYPLRVVPTQLLFDKNGKAYNPPQEKLDSMEYIQYTSVKDPNDIILVHEGLMTVEQLKALIGDLSK
jgi:thioredoxin 1